MLLKLKRSQKTSIGQLRSDVAYEFDMKNESHKTVAESLIKRGMATKISRKDLDAENALAREKAMVADRSEGAPARSAIGETLAIKEQEAAEAAAKAGAEEKAKAGEGAKK